jgi:hypothetical protein
MLRSATNQALGYSQSAGGTEHSAGRIVRQQRSVTMANKPPDVPERIAYKVLIHDHTDPAVISHITRVYNQPPYLVGTLELALPDFLRGRKRKPEKLTGKSNKAKKNQTGS